MFFLFELALFNPFSCIRFLLHQFKAEKLMFVSDDVAHGLVELINLHSTSYLVMGAASDKRYSRYANRTVPFN